MKLSKEDLRFALWNASSFENDGFSEAAETLLNDNLEIEGYERTEWTRFDPNDPKTFPPEGKFFAWGNPDPTFSESPTEFFCWRDEFDFSSNESAAYPEVLFWRPLPPPPKEETEAGK